MNALLLLMLLAGLAPLLAGLLLLKPSPAGALRTQSLLSSALLCTLAFNLTFFWQELWLVVPKALTPGLHPVLFHNDHDWTGTSPWTELLQGTGAVATMVSGLAFAAALALRPGWTPTWRLFAFWMAFQGLYQSLSQWAVGSLLPGNDMGRALAWLQVPQAGKFVLLALAVVGMVGAGVFLARHYPLDGPRGRVWGIAIAVAVLLAVVGAVPFRLPRNLIEVVLIPLLVNLIGGGWTVLGGALARVREAADDAGRPGVLGPALALLGVLALFQVVLRPGVHF